MFFLCSFWLVQIMGQDCCQSYAFEMCQLIYWFFFGHFKFYFVYVKSGHSYPTVDFVHLKSPQIIVFGLSSSFSASALILLYWSSLAMYKLCMVYDFCVSVIIRINLNFD